MTRRALVAILMAAIASGGLALAKGVVLAQEEDTSSPSLRIEWAEFKKLYDKRQLVLIDVRSKEAFEMGHIPGARCIPEEAMDKHVAALKKEKAPIVLYCA